MKTRSILSRGENTSRAKRHSNEACPAGEKKREPFFKWSKAPLQSKRKENGPPGRQPASAVLRARFWNSVEPQITALREMGVRETDIRSLIQGQVACALGAEGKSLAEVTRILGIIGLEP